MTASRDPSPRHDVPRAEERPKKKRKSRPQLSCSECRRLKLKCDRQQPCSSCIRRECESSCRLNEPTINETTRLVTPTNGNFITSYRVNPTFSFSNKPSDDVASLQQRLATLEDFIRNTRPSEVPSISENVSTDMASSKRKSTHDVRSPSPPRHADFARTTDIPAQRDINFSRQTDNHHPTDPDHDPTGLPPAHSFNFTTPTSISFQSDIQPTKNIPVSQICHPPTAQLQLHEPQSIPQYPYESTDSHIPEPSQAFINQSMAPLASNNEEHSHGTLVISRSGRSKYLGRTAAAEWLKNQEVVDSGDSPPPISQMPSPRLNPQVPFSTGSNIGSRNPLSATVAFPFNTASKSISTNTILSVLPPKSEGRILIETYFRHFSWHFNIASRSLVESIFEKAYALLDSTGAQKRDVSAQQLALLFVILAMGAYYNLELAPDDSSVEDYVGVSQACLAKGDFLANNTTAGVMTLHIMAHLLLSMDSGKNGDSAWPLWGLTTHITLAMGLHRDGARWNLPEQAIEERRRVFWETHSTEIMTCNCFSRPAIINPDHVDTAYPKVIPGDTELFHRTRYELSHLFAAVLDHSSKVRTPPYSECLNLYGQICAFERNVPFELRCRPVLCALPSAYPASESAMAASPPTDKRNLHLTFQQFTLAMNISELIVFLNRPYFAQALHDSPGDPTRSSYGQSYLAVVERCNAIVVIATNAHALYPHAAARHWWIWYHAFSSAICMGTLVLKNPQNILSGFAITLIDNVINVYQSVVGSRNSPRMVKNLHWLTKLREKLGVRLVQSPDDHLLSMNTNENDNGDGDDAAELLGWRTRLISRAGGHGLRVSRTIRADSASTCSPSQMENQDRTSMNVRNSVGNPIQTGNQTVPMFTGNSWETEFNQFWESMVHNDGQTISNDPASYNWWGLDALAESGPLSANDQRTT
ncbi:uncharacterized protein L201_002329 [Kwoniella dendrophila CBS 6074]|uniref:Zn(2)-C6 fungal-type domain-containing protein n=1 Tax=Kwoniella dendrophila CBS 6074 TaxID=1295534 RepID=A0AAX4JSE6_9TREE